MFSLIKPTENKILTSAIKLFAKHGFAGTSIDLIAQTARANKERIYAYFGSKSNLFEQCLVSVFEKSSRLGQAQLNLSEEHIGEMTERILTVYLEIHEKFPELHRLLAWGNLDEKILMHALKGIKLNELEHLRELYTLGQHQGIFKQDVSFDVYMFNITAVSFFYYSNSRTMSATMMPGIYTDGARDRLIKETVKLLSHK